MKKIKFMIKIEIKDDLKIEINLSVADSVELVNALVKNKDSVEVKLLITHLSTIIDCYKSAIQPKFKVNSKVGRTLADLLKDINNDTDDEFFYEDGNK
jgi:hypothetical protein